MQKINKYTFLGISFVVTSVSIFLLAYGALLMWENPAYVDSLNLSSDADSLGIPIVGAIMAGATFGGLNILLHLFIFIACLIKEKIEYISVFDFLPKKNTSLMNVFKYIYIIGLLLMVFRWLLNLKFISAPILLIELAFYITFIASALIMLVWMANIFKRDKKY
ncbi:MAG: hypothetical protein V1936_00735 [Patescibacteria group bacterium]